VSPDALDDLVAGCEVAEALGAAGFATGPPVRTADGRVVVTEHALALLTYVPGRELDGETDEEQHWIAGTLAGVHTAGEAPTSAGGWPPTTSPAASIRARTRRASTTPGAGSLRSASHQAERQV
jgi:hypothetical protein